LCLICSGCETSAGHRKEINIDPKELAVTCARIADDKKAFDIIILDLREHIFILDYFVICTATNRRQIHAIADEIDEKLSPKGAKLIGSEGYEQADWVLMDFGGVVVHLFMEEARKFYDLELLWGDCPRVEWYDSELHPAKGPGSQSQGN